MFPVKALQFKALTKNHFLYMKAIQPVYEVDGFMIFHCFLPLVRNHLTHGLISIMFAVCTLINSGYTFNSILGLNFIFHCFGYGNV